MLTGCGDDGGYNAAKKASGFASVNDAMIKNLPDNDKIEQAATDAVLDIGAEKFERIHLGNYNSRSDIYFIDALGKTEDRWLVVSLTYGAKGTWVADEIKNAETGTYYRLDINQDLPYPEDIIDYKTGEVIEKGLTEQEKLEKAYQYLEENKATFIKSTAQTRAKEYSLSTVTDISVNEDVTDPGHYIVLVRLDHSSDKKDLLITYSDDMAATLYDEYSDSINEVAVFWKAPKISSGTMKRAYERRDGGMFLYDQANF